MKNYKEEIAKAIAGNLPDMEISEIEEAIEIPQDSTMGDYAFPCFKLAKIMRKAPPLIAKGIAEDIAGNPLFEKVEQVKAYVNMFISKEEYTESVMEEAIDEDNFGKTDLGHDRTVIVEYSSPNIAKPFHIGHIRSTVIGNSLYKIYDALGFKVVRLNHIGDYGTQFGKMICAYRHWGNKEDVVREPITTLLGYGKPSGVG